MEPLVLFYPNNYFQYQNEDFHWALCGKKVWNPKINKYCLNLSTIARFLGTESGKSFRPVGKLNLIVVDKSKDDVIHDIQKFKFDGVIIPKTQGKCKGPLCPSMYFIFLPGRFEEVKQPEKCPLIKFVKLNNTELRRADPQIPTCNEINLLLKKKTSPKVCKLLAMKLLGQ